MNKDTLLMIVNSDIDIKEVPKEIKILPLGLVKSQKGNFKVDKESFDNIEKQFKGRKLDIVIDYEHQTLHDVQAPAAGWIKELSLKQDGIYATVEWTSKAKEYLSNKEYRYLSPVVMVRKGDNKAVLLHSVALTNTPAIDGMKAIINSMKDIKNIKGVDNMDELKQIAEALELDDTATIDDILKAIGELKASNEDLGVSANKFQIEKLQEQGNELVEMALKTGQINETQKEWALNRCMDDIEGFRVFVESGYKKECNNLIEKALKDGKILPYQKDWALQYALKDYDGFKTFSEESAPVIMYGQALKDNTFNKGNSHNTGDRKIRDMFKLSDDDIKKYNKEN